MAETFGDLDPKIDARKGDVPDKDWGGFHKIEQALYVNNTTAGMSEVAAALQNDVNTLANLMGSVELQPASIANGAVELLNEVSASKITGEEERYSRIDLLDFAGNVQGAKAAFDAVKPLLTGTNAALASQIETRFGDVDTALAAYKVGAGYVLYTRPHPDRHQEALAGDRRPRRAAVEGLEADRQAVTPEHDRGSADER